MEGARVLCIDADLGLRNLDISLGMASEAGLTFLDVMRGDYARQGAARGGSSRAAIADGSRFCEGG